jgi:hypothetical protein
VQHIGDYEKQLSIKFLALFLPNFERQSLDA